MNVADLQSSLPARRHLETELSRMSALVETQLAGAISAFERRDVAAATELIAVDQRVDEYDRDIEVKVMELLGQGALPQEALRDVMTMMKIAGELERVGDLAKNIAKRTRVVSSEGMPSQPASGVTRMGRVSLRQMSDILNAYAARNITAARAVWGGDNELDALYNSVFQEIVQSMMEDPQLINVCTHLVFIAKNFERVGDHATNIAEAIHFLVTGTPLVEERPKGDETSTIAVLPPKHLPASGV